MPRIPGSIIDKLSEAVESRERKPYTEPESFKRLDEFLDEARAGAPDEWLARRLGLKAPTVMKWRKARGITRTRGRARQKDITAWALDPLGSGYDAKLHATGSDVLLGVWEIPEYILRDPIDYDSLCRLLWELHASGFPHQLMARGIGIREKDVETAIQLWAAHLAEVGVPCKGCQYTIDPTYGVLCTKCERKP